MKISHLGIVAAAMLGFGLSVGPAAAQPGPPPGARPGTEMHHPGRPGAHRPPPHRPQVRPHHRKKRVCKNVWRHGHKQRRCYYR